MGGIISDLVGGVHTADESNEPEHGRVIKFTSSSRWQLHFNEMKQRNQLLVIDFYATWCGPCKFIEPAFIDMANRFTDVEFAKLDVDVFPDVAKEFNVTGMPTFVLVKMGKEVDRIPRADKDELEKKVIKHK